MGEIMQVEPLQPAPHRKNSKPTKVNTVYGTQTDNVKLCTCCGKIHLIRNFYEHGEGKALTSKDKKGKLRSMCKPCYDIHKGRYPKKSDNYKPTNDLENFLT